MRRQTSKSSSTFSFGRPAVNPGYDPTKRRVFLNIQQDAPDNVSQDYVHIGVAGVAVKKH